MFTFVPFHAKDFPTYQSWFQDPAIKAALGFVDEEWLDHVLTDEQGIEWVVFQSGKMVAVIGLVSPRDTYECFTITNFAVDPGLQRKGLGSKILHALVDLPTYQGACWVAHVAQENTAAQAFFSQNQWIEKGPDGQGMVEFRHMAP